MTKKWSEVKRGGTEKIADISTCTSPYHGPPSHMVYKPGIYMHTCPACGHKQVFTVRGISV